MTKADLRALHKLAELRALRSAADLAKRQTVVSALEAQAAPLRQTASCETADISQLMVQEKHDLWRADQLSRLTLQLAQAQAAAQPYREAHARDTARAKVIERLMATQNRRRRA
ncbi:hypothetical protein JANAI62_20860 [Jannaschia pagri]|uniref:Flagellar export protein FliJ n=1 Tax=Jannaschia pagri TaxID=2829797 RepID=A0ABQ4NM42_9RHOB|nr:MULTISPECIES: hypothetical protein [unclassified Jannaschia]GIT91629.1 hypothetical protein JANAI61_20870 [Jannaschia sp. AI_61]GIT95463.1 hypothetical protein JANAI62_20860 [Jannaschia sp. AI_62]